MRLAAPRSSFVASVAKKRSSLHPYYLSQVAASDASAAADVCSVDDGRGDSPSAMAGEALSRSYVYASVAALLAPWFRLLFL